MTPLGRFRKSEDGATLVFIAISMPLIMLLLAMVIDLDIGRLTKNRLQIAADSAALAGAAMLPDTTAARTEAVAYALANYPEALSGAPILSNADVVVGHWGGDGFLPDVTPFDAIQVTTRRDETASNPLQTLFSAFAGVDTFEIQASSVAVTSGNELACSGGGILSGTRIPYPFHHGPASSVTFGEGFCLFAEQGVGIGDNNTISEDAVMAMPDTGDFSEGVSNVWHNRDAQVRPADWERPFVGMIDTIRTLTQTGFVPDDAPTEIIADVVLGAPSFPGTFDFMPLDGHRYIVYGNAHVQSGTVASDVVIYTTGEIEIEPNVTLTESILVSSRDIEMGPNVTLGSPSPCNADYFDTYLFANETVEFSSNQTIRGVQIAAGQWFILDGSAAHVEGLYAESGWSASFGNNINFQTCEDRLASAYGALPNTPVMIGNLALVR